MDKNPPLILIVDDNVQNIKVLGNTIKENGWPLAVANSGQQALDFLKRKQPSLILLDIMMPEMDGFETCRKIKSDENTKEIPIIFLTAKNDTASVIKGFDEGAVDYISKPFNPKELIKRVQTHLELVHSKQLLIEQNEIQKELLHVLCHDLNNPLSAILSFAKMMLENPSQSQDFAKHIVSTVKSSLKIIEMTRKLKASEEKEITVSETNLKKAVEQSKFILQSQLTAKDIQLEIQVSENLSVIAEEVSLTNSVINNLLTNAIKFSNSGSTIKIEAETAEEGSVKVFFRDSGIGMSAILVNDLFELTKSTNRPGTDGEKGTGFGMLLVKRFMEKYGGGITISSRSIEEFPEDHGTEVCLVFKT